MFRHMINQLFGSLIEPEYDFFHNSNYYYQSKLMRFVDSWDIHSLSQIWQLLWYIEIISVQAKVVISYDPESNLMLFRTCDFLPKAQPEMALSILHISHFLQNCKKGKPCKIDLPYLKTISQPIETLPKLKIHSRYRKFRKSCECAG